MEIFLCTFIIKLQYIKRGKESTFKKGVSTTFEAVLKSSKDYIIASGNCRPTFLNDTAWFHETYEINSDLLFNPETKTYNQSIVTLEIRTVSKYINTSYSQSFNLAEIAQTKLISERQYSLTGGLIASIELSCSQMQSKGIKPLRRRENSGQKNGKLEDKGSFLLIQKVSFAQTQRETDRDTPQFRQTSLKQFKQVIDKDSIMLENQRVQRKALQQQMHKQIQQHRQTKFQLKSVKQLLENEYNINRQQKTTISRLQKQLQTQRKMTKTIQNQLSDADNESTQLSATISQKQSEVIQLFTLIDQYKQQISILQKKIEAVDQLERSKAQLQWENGTLKKQIQSLKLIVNKQHLTGNQINNELQHIKTENAKLKIIKDKADEELNKVLKREKQATIKINKLTQQRDLIEKQTKKWHSQFQLQSQRKDEQINHLQQHYGQLFKRYEQLFKKNEINPNVMSKEIFDTTVRNYEKKIEQHEDKQSKFKQQLQIIQQEIAKMQEMLQQKQQNQQVLLQHIKKLQKDVQQYAANDNWWSSILDRNQSSYPSTDPNDPQDEKTKLINKNIQLIQLLQKNSKVILQGQKLKIQLAVLKKQNQQLSQKQQVVNDEYNQLKEKIGSLYKENKKLQDKYAKISKQNEHLHKKNLWLQQEITQSKQAQKDARQDYEIVSYQLYKIETAKTQQRNKQQRNQSFLPVIKQNSLQFIASTHHLIKQSSMKQHKNEQSANIDTAIYDQLSRILQQRATNAQQILIHLQRKAQQNPNAALQDVKKQIKKISLSTSKIKSVLIKSGFKQYARQWQSSLLTLSSSCESLVNAIQ